MSDTTGNAAKKPAAPKAKAKTPALTEDERLLAEQAEEEKAVAPAPVDEELERKSLERESDMAAREAEIRRREEELEQRLRAAAEAAVVDDDLPVDELPPAVQAILAGQQAQQAALTDALTALAEKVAGQTGREVQASLGSDGTSAATLIEQMRGTVDDGGDGDDPLEAPVTFISKGSQFKAIRKPRYRGVSPTGEQFFTTGVAADFAPSGQFTTRNREMVAWLQTRPGFQTDFWILGAEPFSAPDPKVIMEQILGFAMNLDDDGLAQLQQEELASHKRKVVLDAIELARTRVQGFEAAEMSS